ncbi:hypothetical protein cyc_07525 [Cyclospora cayetanensis]|uniref:Transmembrane protein n=1 Tax=Cyclospora cayetanensis TaxID=88456 RepID=A0A1D3CZE0_9EIME|nr:hypothetical protein cyc_07525 [Cyclospora cayetanensis]
MVSRANLSGTLRGVLQKARAVFTCVAGGPSSSAGAFSRGAASIKGLTRKGSFLPAAAARVKQRTVSANEQLGAWALREAAPAFRVRGNKYASYPGAPPVAGGSQMPLEQQKKANLLSGILILGAATVLIGTPLYLNRRYGVQADKYRQGGSP